MSEHSRINRRDMLRIGGVGAAGMVLSTSAVAQPGDSLPEIGLYCLNTERFSTSEEPVEISASIYSLPDDPHFAEVEETVSFTLRFPSHFTANCFTSYGARDDKYQRLNFAQATIGMPNGYKYEGQSMLICQRQGENDGETELTIQAPNQFSHEIDHMATCVLEDKQPYTSGAEGVQEHKLMEAIYEAAHTGLPVRLEPVAGLDVFRGAASVEQS